MTVRRPFLLILLTLWGTLCGPGVLAQERVATAIYRIDETDATSGCIGDAGTPRCALDTFFACTMRDRAALCEKIGLGHVPFYLGGGTMEYTVISEITLREEIVPEHLRDHEDYQPGNVLLQVLQRFCLPGERTCPESQWVAIKYYFKPTGRGYAAVSWSGEPWPD